MTKRLVWLGFGVLAVVVAVVVVAFSPGEELQRPDSVSFGDPERGRTVIEAAGCGSCHTIPGVDGADALVGPPLIKWSERGFIAGSLANTPENLLRWVRNPQEVEPGTAMPDLNLSVQEAQDVVAYLFTLD